MEIASCVKAVAMAANQFNNNRSNSNMGYLLHQLEILQTVSGRIESLKPLRPNQLLTYECLTCLTDIMGNSSNKAVLVLRCLQILENLAKDSELCSMLQETFNIDHTLAAILKTYGGAPDDQLTQECLQLLQRVTYGHRISFHESFVDELVKYLVTQILSPPTAITQSCLGVLANLCHDNFPIQARIKAMDNVQRLYKAVCKMFSDQDLTTAAFALSVFTSLSLTEDLGDKVFFNSQNIKQVLAMVFNVLVNGDSMTARNYAVDLLQDLMRNPRLQQAIEEYQALPKCIEDTLKLIASSSSQAVTKVFELLVSFCTVGSLRSCICRLLFSGPVPPADQLTSTLSQPPRADYPPLVAAVCWAVQPVGAAWKAPLAALEFLKEMYEELLCGEDQELQSGINLLLPVLVHLLRELPGTDTSPSMKDTCSRLSGALKLLSVLCSDNEMKAAVAEAVKTQDFATLLDFYMTHNKMVLKQQDAKCLDPEQDWGREGIEVVLLTLQLVSKIRRYVEGLDSYFLELLQDSGMVPFLAHGWRSSDRDLVQIALQLTCLGSSLDNFPDVILGDAVAAANARDASRAAGPADTPSNTMQVARQPLAVRGKENVYPRHAGELSLQSIESDQSIQSLIDKMHSSIELKDLKTADIIEIYEHRLQSHQTKEDHLQDLLEAKSLALAQADRLIAQYRSRQARHGAEAHKMRCLFQEAERKNEGLLQEMNEIKLDKDRLKNEFDLLRHNNNQLELRAKELEELKMAHSDLSDKCELLEKQLTQVHQELNTTKEMHDLLQKHYEALKHQHDTATEQLKKLEDERKQLSKQLKEKETKLLETSKALHTLTEKHSRIEKDRDELDQEKDALEKSVDKLRASISQKEQIMKELQQKVKSLEKLTQELEAANRTYSEKVLKLEGEVSKHAQIAALIHNLSAGKTLPPGVLPSE
ncbi:hypothetical protein BaRGS_00035805 [Batillaria attramentaria]|uniref:CIP2A N-terminal domain-containing protein n=1 Tax=Batillaria attramentaria TaxID=370345 RepID=A0ABD0JDH6_9CAEN